MKRTAGAVLLAAAAVMAILLLFLLSAALPPSAAESRRPYYPVVPFETHLITLRAPPNAGAMDEDAHRRWHESFLPSTVVADYYGDEPRLLDSYYRYVRYGIYAFAARLNSIEVEYVAKKPGVLGSRRCYPTEPTLDCLMTCEAGVIDFDCGALPLLVSEPGAPAASQIDLIARRHVS
jgi:hypothetical protein